MENQPHHHHQAPHNVTSTRTGKPLVSTPQNRLAITLKIPQAASPPTPPDGRPDDNDGSAPKSLIPQHGNSPTSLASPSLNRSSRSPLAPPASQVNSKNTPSSIVRTQLHPNRIVGRAIGGADLSRQRSDSVKRPRSLSKEKEEEPAPVENDDGKARFENGMRISSGYGRMDEDYVGQVLPILDEYNCVGWVSTMEPWMVRGEVYNRIVDPWKRLDVEIYDFLAYMMRSEMEIDGRQICQTRVTNLIKSILSEYPSHEIQVYGSERTMTGLPLADIDIMISVPSISDANPYNLRDRQREVLEKLKAEFLSKGVAERAELRAEASIPLLEITERETAIEFDISFDHGHVTSTLKQMKTWIATYGEGYLVPLVLFMKHALGMRKLGLGTATELYQGGFGSYIIVCMVVIFLDDRLKDHDGQCKDGVAVEPGMGKTLLSFLDFWGNDFDWDHKGITISPPGIVDKLPYTPAFMFEVRNPAMPSRNMAIGSFASRHIRETIKYFHSTLTNEIERYDSPTLIASTPSTHFFKKKENTCPNGSSHSQISGILGSLIGGKYTWHEDRRRKIVSAGNAAMGDMRKNLPPHVRVQIGRHHEVALKKEQLP